MQPRDFIRNVRRASAEFQNRQDVGAQGVAHHEKILRRDGMLREVREETGLSVRVRELLGVYMDNYDTPDGRNIFTLTHYYIVEPNGGAPRAADDAVELRWFPRDALPEQIAFEHARVVLRDLQEKFVIRNS